MLPQLKIAVVSTYPPGMGTLNEYGYYLISALKESELFSEVTVITDELPPGLQYDATDPSIRFVTGWKFNGWTNPFRILREIKRCQPDIVLFNIQFLSFGDRKIQAALGLLTPFLMKLSGYRSVVLLHNILEQVDLKSAGVSKNKLMNQIYNLIGTMLSRFVLSADLVAVTISKYVRILEDKYKARHVALIPHGSFEHIPQPSAQLPDGPARVMTFGKFGTYKRVEVMIEAVRLMRQRSNIPVEIVIAGTDSPNKKGYLAGVQQQYADVPGINFMGYVPEEQVQALFLDSAVVVFPYSSTTGSSGVLHQAGSYAKAVILPDIGDLAMLIREEGYAGELFLPDDPESLSYAIQKVLEDEEYRRSLGQQNYYAATSLPVKDLVNWYYMHFLGILKYPSASVR